MVFTGDALLIEGCGRTDFQSGDSAILYRSIREKLFTLADETLVYPGHDYNGRQVSSIGQEKERNPRLGMAKTEAEFITIMNDLELPYPRKIDFAVPGNEQCGKCPANVPPEFQGPCLRFDQGE
jgi:sulfur dioxygenase